MARKTKAEKAAELAQHLEQQMAENARAYPDRLMKLLEEATEVNDFRLTVLNGVFQLEQVTRNGDSWQLQLNYSEFANETLDDLSFTLSMLADERAELERVANLRVTALAKLRASLTEEERKVLDLP